MKWWRNLFNRIRKAVLTILGIIVIEKLVGPDDVTVEIDSEGIDFVSIDAYFVIVIFNNKTANSFPADKGKNLASGYNLKQAALKNKLAS